MVGTQSFELLWVPMAPRQGLEPLDLSLTNIMLKPVADE